MSEPKNVVRIIEQKTDEVNTKLLSISFETPNDLKLLFLPRLENIGFVVVNNNVTISLKDPGLRDFFNDWVVKISEKISVCDSTIERIEKFNYEMKSILKLAQKEQKLSINNARGLYGEFLQLKAFLSQKRYPKQEIINGWHRPAPANHDFDYEDFSMEVKTGSRDNTTIKITSEHQLMAIENKPLQLKFYRLEAIDKSDTDGLGELYNEIKQLLQESGLINRFEIKCAEDKFSKYPGPEHMPLDYKFYLIEEGLYKVDQSYFPRVRKEQLDIGISKTSYNIDISAIDQFQIL